MNDFLREGQPDEKLLVYKVLHGPVHLWSILMQANAYFISQYPSNI